MYVHVLQVAAIHGDVENSKERFILPVCDLLRSSRQPVYKKITRQVALRIITLEMNCSNMVYIAFPSSSKRYVRGGLARPLQVNRHRRLTAVSSPTASSPGSRRPGLVGVSCLS